MKIDYQQIAELHKIFASYWSSKYHVGFEVGKLPVKTDDGKEFRLDVIDVKVNDTDLGGEGQETWSFEYAYSIFKSPKEMEQCIKRWQEAFAKAKRRPTLDILGLKNVTLN